MKRFFDFVTVLFAAFLMALNIKIFVNSAGLLPGGFTGVTILLQKMFSSFVHIDIPFSVFYWLLNAFPAIICFGVVGKKFTILSILMIFASGLATDFLPAISITNDILLSSIFGGIINGISICMCLFAGASSGGTDFISIYFSEKKGYGIWYQILIGNCIVLGIFGTFFGWTNALYSIIFQYVSTQIITALYKRYRKSTILIISDKTDEIISFIKNTTKHDATTFIGKGGYQGAQRTLIYTVVSKNQEEQLFHKIKTIDSNAFINVLETKALRGKFYLQKL